MSENLGNVGDGPSAGTLLRQAREAAGLHVATLAANLKVPVHKLEALEEDRYEALPDAVFVRALASTICRTLKVDPAPVLQRLPQTPNPRLAAEGRPPINEPFHSPKDGPPPGLLAQVSRPVVLTVVALLLGALVLIFLPFAQRGYETVTQADASAAPPVSIAPAEPRPEQPTTAAVPGPGSVAGLPGVPASAAGPVPTPAAVTQAPEAAGPAGVQLRASTEAPGAAASAAVGANDPRGIVVFRARTQSWVQVKDARGTTVMQRLLEPGESVGANGALPLSVIVGSAQSTEVQVRGKPLDLAPLARDNVARFEVK
jgi:cytoskeleton protein RodZ